MAPHRKLKSLTKSKMLFDIKIPKLRELFIQFKNAHYNALFEQLDAVQSIDYNQRPSLHIDFHQHRTNTTFAIISLMFTTIFLDSIFGMQYEYFGRISFSELATSPYISWHQIPPVQIWFSTDAIMIANTSTTLAIYVLLSFHSPLPERFLLFPLNNGRNLVVDGRILKEKVSKKILRFCKLSKKAVILVAAIFEVVIVYGYCYYRIFLAGKIYRFSVHTAWMWFVAFPLFFFYIVHGNSKC